MDAPREAAGGPLRYRWRRLRNHAHKLRWGVRAVGAGATARGLVRLARMRLSRAPSATVDLDDGGRLTFRVPDEMSPALVVFGRLIDPEYPFLRRVHQPGWTHWDVGAAVGQYTVFAARLPRSAVHAFEPNPSLARRLRQNVSDNHLTAVVSIHEVAVTPVSGPVRFAAEASPFVGGVLPETVDGGLMVDGVALDEVAEQLGIERVDVLKVNVAGHEADVLRGATTLLAAGRVGILVLLVGDLALPAFRDLAGYGYRFAFYDTEVGDLVEVREITSVALRHPPSPARHVIALHGALVADGQVLGVPLRSTEASG